MITYLNKEAVLTAVHDPDYIGGVIARIERGEFDAKLLSACAECQKNHGKTLADREAEIRRLSNALASEKHVCDNLSEACGEHEEEIARLEKELFFVSSSAGIRGKSILASFRIIGDLKARIAELEKLTESQQGIINQQTEARQKARANMAKELSTIIQQEWQCSLPEILYIIECVEKGKYKEFPKPAQKKPDLNTENLIEDLQDQCAELRSRVYPGMAEYIGGLIP
jgi:hypothetical protein